MGEVYNPLRRFGTDFRDSFAGKASDFFEKLLRESGVDPAENARLVREYNIFAQKYHEADSRHSAYGWGIVVMVIALVASFFGMLWALSESSARTEASEPILFLALCIVVALVSIVSIFSWLLPARKKAKALSDEYNAKAISFKKQAYEQMRPLNRLYTWDIPVRLIEKAMPDINFDNFSNEARISQFRQEFDWDCQFGDDSSVLFTQTGELAGNPFAFCKLLNMQWGVEVYTGSITIHWTTVERDSKGKPYTRHHTQTLTASVTKPKPEYYESTLFVFANDAAPNLSFTRKCSGLAQKQDSLLGRLSIRHTRKKLEAFSRNLEDESNYTMMTNKDFETFFNTMNRDNENEFRVMFTVMAQNNMMELLKDNSIGYGDDFDFVKDNKINIIRAEHLNKTDLDTRPEKFHNYCLEDARRNFIAWTSEYFRSLYFAMAPILSIPVYMQTLPQSKFNAYPELALDTANFWECEATANYLGEKRFAHPSSVTRNILKVVGTNRSGERRNINVTAYGYRTVKHTEHVTKFGGDGKFHDVPVHWLEYLPVSNSGNFSICEMRSPSQGAQQSASKADFFRRNIFVFK